MLHAVLRSVPQLLVVVLNPEKKVAWRQQQDHCPLRLLDYEYFYVYRLSQKSL
jgi:hypothetical protein